jgi:hypothetical protein
MTRPTPGSPHCAVVVACFWLTRPVKNGVFYCWISIHHPETYPPADKSILRSHVPNVNQLRLPSEQRNCEEREKNEGIESEQPRDPVFGETTELTLELDRAASKTCDGICSAPVNGQ